MRSSFTPIPALSRMEHLWAWTESVDSGS
uniref:Uncharacterized protein n=1 Tax=Arundo donax TaxID=35708 RepID=A0A0A8ZGS2_ARUDO